MSGTGDSDEVVRAVTARLPSGVAVKVEAVTDEASDDGMTSVGLRHLELADALDSVGEIGALVVSRLGKARLAERHGQPWYELDALRAHAALDRAENIDRGWSGRAGVMRERLVPGELDPDPLATVERLAGGGGA